VSGIDPNPSVIDEGDSVYLHVNLGEGVRKAATACVTTEKLGKARITGLAYENADGSAVIVDSDYFARKRDRVNPSAGPFEQPGQGEISVKVW